MWSSTLVLAASLAGFFEVASLPLPGPHADSFLVDLQGDGLADLGILDGQQLLFYEQVMEKAALQIALPEKTTAIDIIDLDNDGWCEVLVVAGNAVRSTTLLAQPPYQWQTLFECGSDFAALTSAPFLHVLAVSHQDTLVLALPTERGIELRALGGELMETYAFGSEAGTRITYGRPFIAWGVHPSELGGPEALEFRINRVSASKPDLPEDLILDDSTMMRSNPVNLQRAQLANVKPPEKWPLFPLTPAAGQQIHAAIAVSEGIHPLTLVSTLMEDPAAVVSEKPSIADKPGPIRRYPGVPLFTENWPDFDGDGYYDLLLWRIRDLQPTLNRVTSALLDGRWPVRLTAHLFTPAKERFASAIVAQIDTTIPTEWLLSAYNGLPLRHLVVHDIDGDKRSDLAFSNGPNTFNVFICNSDGILPAKPSFTRDFEEEIAELTFVQDLNGDGKASIGLKGSTQFFILNPARAAVEVDGLAPILPALAP
ncbi:MAG: hypothetical protein HYV27_11225 [Candidatus Hydrogenedentes bacterium]|nr:hypothetical protein [Candidatus Hydrogenedentota bacterium]